ncbi:MAG TPA: glycosyltransferase family 39 protein [Bryobacteraceae bacterium]|nr:glycosyltransferase family 39 protein [Bryobacteraceae bacterium]
MYEGIKIVHAHEPLTSADAAAGAAPGMPVRAYPWIVLAFAVAVFIGCLFSPPHLLDDVDAVQASIARNMVESGDWVTAHLDGIRYLEKAPLKYWLMAVCYQVLGIHDWVARLPIALAAIALCWLAFCMGRWAFSERAGFFSGLVLSTCVGLFLFTRFLIPDALLTVWIALSLWAFARALDAAEQRPRLWAAISAASIALGVLTKGLIGAVFPVGAAFVYLALTHQLFRRDAWRRIRPFSGLAIALAIAAPWHVLATLRNPPYFYFSLHAGPGQYHGFFWFYFFNEHLLRFLGRRYPVDYNTVPRLAFWLLHLVWLFPWAAFFPATFRLSYRGDDRASRMRLLALCWIGFVLIFFTFSTTQEYYSLPCYPAFALLLGCAIASERRGNSLAYRVIGGIALAAAAATIAILIAVWNLPAPGDIANALNQQSSAAYTLSMGHMGDLTLAAFAYLRVPLMIAAAGFLIGAAALFTARSRRAWLAPALMMLLFLHAARVAMITFDPYLSSQPLAQALEDSKPGRLIADDQYYFWSSVFFYAHRGALLLNGRINNLEYGSYAPDAPNVFIDDRQLAEFWGQPQRFYLLVAREALPRIERLIPSAALFRVKESGGKYLFTNHADWH